MAGGEVREVDIVLSVEAVDDQDAWRKSASRAARVKPERIQERRRIQRRRH